VRDREGALGIAPRGNLPVFVDDTGSRRWWFRGGGLVACALCAAYLALVVFGLTGHGPLSGLRLPILAPHHGNALHHPGNPTRPPAASGHAGDGAQTASELATKAATTTSTTAVVQGGAPTATTMPPDPPSSPTTVASTKNNNGNAGGNGKGKGEGSSNPGKSGDAPGHNTNGKAAH
jgi:hypothetical protein